MYSHEHAKPANLLLLLVGIYIYIYLASNRLRIQIFSPSKSLKPVKSYFWGATKFLFYCLCALLFGLCSSFKSFHSHLWDRSMTLLFAPNTSSSLPSQPLLVSINKPSRTIDKSLNDIGQVRIKNFDCSFFRLHEIGFGVLSITIFSCALDNSWLVAQAPVNQLQSQWVLKWSHHCLLTDLTVQMLILFMMGLLLVILEQPQTFQANPWAVV